MALNDNIERWVLQQSADRISAAVTAGQVSMADLADLAARKPLFAAKYAIIKQIVESRPNPAEQQEFARIESLYLAGERSPELFSQLSTYTLAWAGNTAAAEHVATAKKWMAIIKEQNDYAQIEHRATADLARHAENSSYVPSGEIEQAIAQYMAEWNGSGVASDEHLNMVENWGEQIKSIRARKKQTDWDALFDSEGHLRSIDGLKEFAQNYPGDTTYSGRIDDTFWTWVTEQPDVMAAAADYDRYFNHMGKHSGEYQNLGTAKAEWDTVDKTDIFGILEYLESHPGTPFSAEARNYVSDLKDAEIELMKRQPNTYSDAKFRRLYYQGAATREELTEAVGGDTEVFERILNLETERREKLVSIPNPIDQTFSQGGPGQTDIVFFGMPSSGKTCVLTGLFASERLTPDTSDWNGRYALALQSYGEAMIAPPRTITQFVAVISSEIYKTHKGKQYKVPFNLVDMAGEDFRDKIAQIDEDGDNAQNENAVVSFKLMGNGAPEVLSNDHDKVFFVLIDPQATGRSQRLQNDAIRILVGLFENKANEDIMRRVRGLHFIVTKADTLQGNRLSSARNVVCGILNEAARTKLCNFCVDNGINASADEKLNGHPRVFGFSLGQFHPGNIYSGSQHDSNVILDLIGDYVVGERRADTGYKIRKFFTQAII